VAIKSAITPIRAEWAKPGRRWSCRWKFRGLTGQAAPRTPKTMKGQSESWISSAKRVEGEGDREIMPG
jgi:hypothetical protein